MEDLKIFETVEEITGWLYIEPDDYIQSLTNLDMFRNLKKIGGNGAQ